MTKYQSFKNGLCATIMAISPILLSAQLVKHDRLLSFESTEVPSFVAGIHSIYLSPVNIIKTVHNRSNGNSSREEALLSIRI